ncbi:hypothetical protein [Kitasatospora sp. NPDC098663]|uniref:hypothetical protein n=1 Tax=Kitasatospora sp. NPDC098663 TaxID=3364096 RepID=UPI00382FC90D
MVGRLLVLEDGWADRGTAHALGVGPQPGWSAALVDSRLVIRRPGGLTWFDGEITATREWRRRVRDDRALLLITGSFLGVFDFPVAAAAGQLFLLSTPIQLTTEM